MGGYYDTTYRSLRSARRTLSLRAKRTKTSRPKKTSQRSYAISPHTHRRIIGLKRYSRISVNVNSWKNSKLQKYKLFCPNLSAQFSTRYSVGIPESSKSTRPAASFKRVKNIAGKRSLNKRKCSKKNQKNAVKELIDNFIPLDLDEGSTTFPRAAWGEREETGLSKIGRAEKQIQIWNEVKRAHEDTPSVVPFISRKLDDAKAKREELTDCEENHRIGAINSGAIAIKQRIEELKEALSSCEFKPEAENIRGAISGYKSGTIEYSNHYTILYAGKVVDSAAHYSEFVRDREQRLDRYAKAHGPHWMFYESPLDVHPESKPIQLMSTATLERAKSWSNFGPYHIYQGFWKRSAWVNRMPILQSATTAPLRLESHPRNSNLFNAGEVGPRQAFRMLLDSGSTYPSLYGADLDALGINRGAYACQSIERMMTSRGPTVNRVYEMFVCILDEQQKQLVDAENPVWPITEPVYRDGTRKLEPRNRYIGGLCPVVEMPGPIEIDVNGIEQNIRLSGLLPFVSCYMSTTPTVNRIFLGEDRRDVLGAQRMPGQRRWDTSFRPSRTGPPAFRGAQNLGNPTVIFDHNEGEVLDQDEYDRHRSRIFINRGKSNEEVIHIDPAKELRRNEMDDTATCN